MIESILKDKFVKFFRFSINDIQKFFEFVDLFIEILSLKEQIVYKLFLVYFDFLVGINLIIEKLFYNMREKWILRVYNYKEIKQCFLLFKFFVDFVREMSCVRNDLSFFFIEIMNILQKFICLFFLVVKI